MLVPQICTDRGTHTRVHALTPNFTSTHVSGLNSNFVCFICFTSFRLISFRFRFFSSFYPLWRPFYSISTQSSDNSSISVSVWVCVWVCRYVRFPFDCFLLPGRGRYVFMFAFHASLPSQRKAAANLASFTVRACRLANVLKISTQLI